MSNVHELERGEGKGIMVSGTIFAGLEFFSTTAKQVE